MISKQINTYEKKIERANQIISIREKRLVNNKKLIKLIDDAINQIENSEDIFDKIKVLELKNKKLDVQESNIENEIALRIQKEILNEDMAAYNRLLKEKEKLYSEISLWNEYVEKIKQIAANIRRRNPKADLSRLTNAVAKSYEPFESEEERLDHFKLLKQLAQIKY